MKIKKNKALEVLGEFVGHMALGAAMFMSLALVSGMLTLFMHWYVGVFGSEHEGLFKLVEVGILYADIVFLFWWAIFSTFKAIKDL